MAAWVDAGQVEKKAEKAEVVQTGMIGSIAEQFQHTWPEAGVPRSLKKFARCLAKTSKEHGGHGMTTVETD